jgi:hypothetical protein
VRWTASLTKAFAEFRSVPEFKEFFNQSRFGASLDIKEESDKYVIRAYLPDRDMNNVNVTVEGQTLKVEAKRRMPGRGEGRHGLLAKGSLFPTSHASGSRAGQQDGGRTQRKHARSDVAKSIIQLKVSPIISLEQIDVETSNMKAVFEAVEKSEIGQLSGE